MLKKAIFPVLSLMVALTPFALAETTVTTIRETTVVDGPVVAPLPPVVVPSTTITTYTTTPSLRIAPRVVHFEDFDFNLDRVLTMNEVGMTLFRIYDTDGNQVIDNVEYERPAVVTIMPMNTTTRVTYDFNNDGIGDQTVYSYDTFMQRTWLGRFDRNSNGLSAHEFSGKSFLETDIDNSRAIEAREWQGIYVASIDARNKADAALNK